MELLLSNRHWPLRLGVSILTSSALLGQSLMTQPALAQTAAYCQFTKDTILEKQSLLKGSLKGESDNREKYKKLVRKHAEFLQKCRARTWPNNQAIWLRLYACDLRPGAIDEILDRIVNRGYNQVYVEVLGDSQVLIPAAENNTPWPSTLRSPGDETADLLAQAIQKGRERGLKVYAWMFAMNFGYTYSLRPDRRGVLARNGRGENALISSAEGYQAFVDPYNQTAKTDYYKLVQAVVRRRPDGVLFDYIRYPRREGGKSVASKVQDLWIYGSASQQALIGRALNSKGRELIRRFISRGYITAGDIQQLDRYYLKEGPPLWQGRTPSPTEMQLTLEQRRFLLNWELWQFSVAHAAQGIIDFLNLAAYPARKQGIRTGAVFFPDGNRPVGQTGYDTRLQPWDRFPKDMEWHPMLYAVCSNVSCIQNQLKRVLGRASQKTVVSPVLAGVWGRDWNGRPSLELQMAGIRQVSPQVKSISHFAFSWQEPTLTRERQSCRR
ncbi:MAG: family 10 glycosylhydrolase [Cyanosarcina radialis HA8281-LM2]|nr:family 10 glycosylhydrolase [Cyanosarcina radialis HA8281-LM2]